MLNIEKYEEEIKKQILKDRDIPCIARELRDGDSGCGECRNCVTCGLEMLYWLLQEYKEPILNDEEKKILKDIIRAFEPFDWKPVHITKINHNLDEPTCYLEIGKAPMSVVTPDFDGNGMFTGMKAHKSYTFEELGL